MSPELPSLRQKLLRQTNFLGLRLWVLIVALLALVVLVLVFLLCLYHIYCRPRKPYNPHYRLPNSIIATSNCPNASSTSSLRRLLPPEIEAVMQGNQLVSDRWSSSSSRIQNLVGELEYGGRWSSASLEAWRGYMFTIKDIELATNGFSEENVIGNGDNGVVYRGILLDHRRIAVKRLIYKNFPMENFITGVEAITHVRHKNVVRMLGYCIEADDRILVYEYVDNGNLHHWLHGSLGSARPLSWRIRINIIQGIAKGLAYLHEDIEPKIIHGDLKSRNILLDNQWNPKISDAALTAGLLNPHSGLGDYSLTSLMPDEKSDVHNFGILIMEIVTGKNTVIDCGESPVYLVDWLKSMVASKKIEQVVDPTLSDQIINLLELKRIILIVLRCVVAEVEHRPKMKDVIHMLEPLDLLLNDKAYNKRKDSSNNDGHAGLVEEGACNVRVEEEAAITSMKKMSTIKPL